MGWRCWCAGRKAVAAAACNHDFSVGSADGGDDVGCGIVENAVAFAAVVKVVAQYALLGLDIVSARVVHEAVVIAGAEVVVAGADVVSVEGAGGVDEDDAGHAAENAVAVAVVDTH